jgi:hypothetical protein
MKKTNLLLITVIAALFIAVLFVKNTASQKEAELQTELDSMQIELQTKDKMAQNLNEIGALMDSIDANRETLRLNVLEGISTDDYVTRMEGLKTYVKNTERKIEELEATLKKSKSSNTAYKLTIKSLKSEIGVMTQQIASLTETVNRYKTDNENLVKINEVQGLDLLDKLQQIETKKQEVAKLENKVIEVSENAKQSLGNEYLAHAKTAEEIANRTKFAPKKKKAALTQSLELYRKAALYGNEQARVDIERIESQLN